MRSSISLFSVLVLSTIFVFIGCQLDPQSAKQKMAFNNFMSEVKATNFMDGKVGNIKYEGNQIAFDFTDSSMTKDDMQKIIYHLSAQYVNANNRAQTGITILRLTAKRNGQPVVKAVYQAGPSMGDDITSLVKLEWYGEFAGSNTETTPGTNTAPGTGSAAGAGK